MKRSLVATLALFAAVGCGSDPPVTPPPVDPPPSVPPPPPPPPPPPSGARYEMIDAGTPAGTGSQVGSLSNDGTVHFFVDMNDGTQHVFRWSAGTTTDLGALPGFAGPKMSANGRVGGFVRTCTGSCDSVRAGYVWNAGTMTELPLPAPTRSGTVRGVNDRGALLALIGGRTMVWTDGVLREAAGADPMGIAYMNASGQVAGTLAAPGGAQTHAFLFDNGVVRDLGALSASGTSNATAISDNGDVIGYSSRGVIMRAVVWRGGGAIEELNVAPGEQTFAHHINGSGQIMVQSGASGRWYLVSNGATTALDTATGTSVHGLTGRGEPFGGVQPNETAPAHAWVWRDGARHDLGAGADGKGAVVVASNERGDLLGYSVMNDGKSRVVLWRRVS